MSDSTLRRVREELLPYAEVVDLRGFGESALDSRLIPLVDEVLDGGARARLITNLTPRNPAWWHELGSRSVLVGVSLEATSPELYEETRRGAKYARFVANLDALSAAQAGRGVTDDVYLNVVITPETLEEPPNIVRFAHDHGVGSIYFQPMSYEDDNGELAVGISERTQIGTLRESLLSAQRLSLELGVTIRIGASLTPACDLGGFDGHCIHPWSYVFVRYDGAVGFCDHLVAHDGSIMGNLNHEPFMSIWNGHGYRELRMEHLARDFGRIKQKRLECNWCYDNRMVDSEDLLESTARPLTLDNVSIGRLLPIVEA